MKVFRLMGTFWRTQITLAWARWNGAVLFYTCLPLPERWPAEFARIAQWAPWVGVLLGGLLAISDGLLALLQMPELLRSTLVVCFGIVLTGGLHVDGVMDVADGLAVPDKERRLAVMSDSRVGAFGVMAAIALLGLKVAALSALSQYRPSALVLAALWGRSAQQWAIAGYPYLKVEGKGAFHKAACPSAKAFVPSFMGLVIFHLLLGISGLSWGWVFQAAVAGMLFSACTSAYFARQLGGHTGDTYGAVVEWTEALVLCAMATGAGAGNL